MGLELGQEEGLSRGGRGVRKKGRGLVKHVFFCIRTKRFKTERRLCSTLALQESATLHFLTVKHVQGRKNMDRRSKKQVWGGSKKKVLGGLKQVTEDQVK